MTEQILRNPNTDAEVATFDEEENEHFPRDGVATVGQTAIEATVRTSALQAEVGVSPAYETIEAAIEVMEQDAYTSWLAMQDAYDSSSQAEQQRIDELMEGFTALVDAAEEEGQKPPSLTVLFETVEGIPEQYKTSVLANEAITAKIEAAENELERYAPEKAAEIAQKAAKLEAGLDYDKTVAQAYVDVDDPTPFEGSRVSSINILYDVGKVVRVRKLLESNSPLTFQQLKSVENSLKALASDFENKGLMREGGDVVDEETPMLTDDELSSIEAHIEDVYQLRTKYKSFDRNIRNKVQGVLDLTRQMKDKDDDVPADLDGIFTQAKIRHNEGLGLAMNRRLIQKLKELPADEIETDINSEAYAGLIEEARSVDSFAALQQLEISGSFEKLPFDLSESELKLFLLRSVPAAAIASVERISFRALTKEEDEEDNTRGLHVWSEELGGSEIIISDTKVHEHYQNILELFGDVPFAKQYAQERAKERMFRSIVHEFGHELHEILPLASLKRWEDQRSTDQTNITPYVKDRHDSKHRHRYMEDFADTMTLFINQPEELMVISPTRFYAMRQIFEEIMPIYPEITAKLQIRRIANDKAERLRSGISDEEARSTYLSHESA